MQIIAHRGEWTDRLCPETPNTLAAFYLALEHGFGVEVDVRDRNGELVISHNPPLSGAPELKELLAFYKKGGFRTCMAFNVKADGLQPLLKEVLEAYGITNYFTFDMSVPNTLADAGAGVRYFLRQSEYEREPASLQDLYAGCAGIWMDQFVQNEEVLEHNFQSVASYWGAGKSVCWVSPELHSWGRREEVYQPVWKRLKDALKEHAGNEDRLLLCTDYPARAKEFFYGK